jgi:hypothetical protein
LSILKRLGAVAVLAGAGLVAVAAPPGYADTSACPAAPDKCYSTTASPATIPQNAPTSLDLTINNDSTSNGNLSIGSVNVTIPAGVTVSSAQVGQTAVTPVGNVVPLRNLSIAPGSSATLTMTVNAENAVSGCWATAAKQSNDFNGTGNNFTQHGGCSPITAVSVKCQSIPQHDGCKETVWHTNVPFSVTTSPDPDMSSTLTAPAIAGPDQAVVFVIYNKRGGSCFLGQACTFEVVSPHGLSSMPVGSDATLDFECVGAVCPNKLLPPYLLTLTNEVTGSQTLLLTCPISLSPLTPTKACGSTSFASGKLRAHIEHISDLDDWKAGG